MHASGWQIITNMLSALFQPDLAPELIRIGISSSLETLGYALISMSFALFFGSLLAILSSGVIWSNKLVITAANTFNAFLRAIHELVWAWLFVAAIGLSPIAGVLALAIPYTGFIAKFFADYLQEVPSEPIKALQTAGANRWQCLLYGYIPYALPNMLSYTMYRLECAVLSSSVLSFIGLGGIGFQIQMSLNDLKYNEVATLLFFLILMVFIINWWASIIRKQIHLHEAKSKVFRNSAIGILVLMIWAWITISLKFPNAVGDLINTDNLRYMTQFLQNMAGVGETVPAYLNGEKWLSALRLSFDTIVMSIIAAGLAAIAMIFFIIPAAENVANGQLMLRQRWYYKPLYFISRSLFLVARSIPELMWAMIILYIFKPGILPGALALAIHNFGVLGKLCAEAIEDTNPRPIRNMAINGANQGQMMLYGILPSTMPQILGYILYRYANVVRSTLIVGFVGAGGLGLQFKLAMSYFKYSEITLYLICYVIMVLVTDLFGKAAKRFIKG